MTRPFVRKTGLWWHIHIGRTSYVIGDYYASQDTAFRQAERLFRKAND